MLLKANRKHIYTYAFDPHAEKQTCGGAKFMVSSCQHSSQQESAAWSAADCFHFPEYSETVYHVVLIT